jgi:hypothetical protein
MTAPPEQGLALLRHARLLARISAFFCILTVFGILDGLQELVRNDYNHIDMLPGESASITGMYPAGASQQQDIIARLEGAEGLHFTLAESYKGFWLGGQMWRGVLSAAPDMPPGKATLTIIDVVLGRLEGTPPQERRGGVNPVQTPGIQNPALTHTITVWESAAARRAAEHAYAKRYLGLPPFGAAAIAFACAFLGGFAHLIFFQKAEKSFAAQGVFFIHGVKFPASGAKSPTAVALRPADRQTEIVAAFSLVGRDPMPAGAAMILYSEEWKEMGRGMFTRSGKGKGYASFASVTPRYGWLVEAATKEDAPG